jgi:hypothetical protein
MYLYYQSLKKLGFLTPVNKKILIIKKLLLMGTLSVLYMHKRIRFLYLWKRFDSLEMYTNVYRYRSRIIFCYAISHTKFNGFQYLHNLYYNLENKKKSSSKNVK